MTRPNFFIVGAPKCGTTALCEYLRAHPNVFISPIKEPHYFAEDFAGLGGVTDYADYIDLFSETKSTHSAIGEGSVWYLYSDNAIEKILNFCSDAKIIVMLRNPIDLVYSMHSQAIMTLDEDELDFRKSWELCEARRQGINVPDYCREPRVVDYKRIGKLGQVVERLLKVSKPENVKIILFEDFRNATEKAYLEVLSFLEVPRIQRPDYPRINANKRRKLAWVAQVTQRPPRKLVRAVLRVKSRLGIERLGFLDKVRKLNTDYTEREDLDPEFRAELVDFFRQDVMKLEGLLGRDLSCWLK